MFKKFQAHRKYAIRHKILMHLKEKVSYDEMHVMHLGKSATDIEVLAKEIGFKVEDVVEFHHALHVTGAEQINCHNLGAKHIITLEEAGIDAAIDEYWLREGQKELNERIYDKTKWMLPLLALALTLGSLLYSAIKVERATSKVDQLDKRLRSLESKYISTNNTAVKASKPQADTSHSKPK